MKSSISRRLPGSSLRGSEPRRGCRIKMRWPYAYAAVIELGTALADSKALYCAVLVLMQHRLR